MDTAVIKEAQPPRLGAGWGWTATACQGGHCFGPVTGGREWQLTGGQLFNRIWR